MMVLTAIVPSTVTAGAALPMGWLSEPSPGLLVSSVKLTFALGFESSSAVKVAVPPPSVVTSPPGGSV